MPEAGHGAEGKSLRKDTLLLPFSDGGGKKNQVDNGGFQPIGEGWSCHNVL